MAANGRFSRPPEGAASFPEVGKSDPKYQELRKQDTNRLDDSSGFSETPPLGADSALRCLVVHPSIKGERDDARSPAARLSEAVGLAGGIDLAIVHAEVVNVPRVRPATLFGRGTVDRLGAVISGKGEDGDDDSASGKTGEKIELVIVDAALSPVQQRNLERAMNCKVIDRTGLILEIFGARARTREGRLQVELASLTYQRSRLVRSWTHLERQRGGFGFMGGPGEAQIEIDRRILGDRITRLRKDLKEVKRTRALQRRARQRVPYPVVALVGYTNAGKSTMFNRLTNANVTVQDQLFATLDPTMRELELPSGRKVILSDTVGFISELPHELVAAFHATLEEVCEADLIVHVRDASHPDSDAQRDDVHGVLRELGLEEVIGAGMIEALNKIDLVAGDEREVLANQAMRDDHASMVTSAATGEGCEKLLTLLDARLAEARELISADIELSDGASLAWLYAHGEVLERLDDESHAHVKVRLDAADAA
ncbi:MAG: GTPase HflX, partial [Rhodospirillales bacterium]|nr:GTPase HflX [Rhodospirillales bacterium]